MEDLLKNTQNGIFSISNKRKLNFIIYFLVVRTGSAPVRKEDYY
jgi:hypothetical protein